MRLAPALLVALLLCVGACGDDEPDAGPTQDTEVPAVLLQPEDLPFEPNGTSLLTVPGAGTTQDCVGDEVESLLEENYQHPAVRYTLITEESPFVGLEAAAFTPPAGGESAEDGLARVRQEHEECQADLPADEQSLIEPVQVADGFGFRSFTSDGALDTITAYRVG